MTQLLRRAGFTLIELTLVTLILLSIIGLSIPLFKKTFADLSAKNTSFNISKLINYGQEMAVLGNKNYKIVFNFEKGNYQLLETDAAAKSFSYKKIKGRFGRLFIVPQGIFLSGNRKEMIFYPDGHCDDIKLFILVKKGGYSIVVKRFGNMVEINGVTIE